MRSIVVCISSLAVSFLISFLIAPATARLAFAVGAIDMLTEKRKLHRFPIPRLGGIGIFASIIIVSALAFSLGIKQEKSVTLFAGTAAIVLLGIADDIFGIHCIMKLMLQTVCALFAVSGGIILPLGVLSVPLTVLFIVGMTNAFNMIDGLDSLCCGVSAIASIALGTVSVISFNYGTGAVFAAISGGCTGFLPFNRYPAKMFIGDSGATMLGYLISCQCCLLATGKTQFLVLLLPLTMPIFDLVFAFFRRVLKGKNPLLPDDGHIHHLLIKSGLSHKKAALIILLISAILAAFSVFFCVCAFR